MVNIHRVLSDNLVDALGNCVEAIAPYCHRTEEQKIQAQQKYPNAYGGPEELLAELQNILKNKELRGTDIERQRLCGLMTLAVHFLKRTSFDDHHYVGLPATREQFTRLANLLTYPLGVEEGGKFHEYDTGIKYFEMLGVRLLRSINIIADNIHSDKRAEVPAAEAADNITEMPEPGRFASREKPRATQMWLGTLKDDTYRPRTSCRD